MKLLGKQCVIFCIGGNTDNSTCHIALVAIYGVVSM